MSVSTTRLAALCLLAFAGAAFAADLPNRRACARAGGGARSSPNSNGLPPSTSSSCVNDSDSADWNNLMGYTHRKAKTPDYAAAEPYYDAALRIDPKHCGASNTRANST